MQLKGIWGSIVFSECLCKYLSSRGDDPGLSLTFAATFVPFAGSVFILCCHIVAWYDLRVG